MPSDLDYDERGLPKAPIEVDEDEEELAELERQHAEKKALVMQRHQYQTSLADSIPIPKPGAKVSQFAKTHLTTEDYDAFGYPKVPEEWTEEWFREQHEKEKTDPRHNPNLLLDSNSQEFWNNVARRPYAKAIQKQEQHWVNRRNVWLRQYETVTNMNAAREEIAGLLEDCSMDVKRLVTPVLHHKICEAALWSFVQESKEKKIPFKEILKNEDNLSMLHSMRMKIDRGGDQRAAEMMDEYDYRSRRRIFDQMVQKDKEKPERIVADTDLLVKCLNAGQKLKKDGMIEWENREYDDALNSWRQADAVMKKHRAPDHDASGNQLIADLHTSVLKNLSQAAIKLERWTEALEAADDALKIDDQDHKTWFRKACALEGLGRLDEEDDALDKIEELAVGRQDCDRITKEVQTKRDKLQSLRERDKATQTRAMARAVEKGIFSGDREAKVPEVPKKAVAPSPAARGPKEISSVVRKGDRLRRKLTKDGAAELLDELRRSYSDSTFQKQIKKMAGDVKRDKTEFLTNLRKVSFDKQIPLLDKWGFQANAHGVQEMQLAIQDHTMGPKTDKLLKEKADAVTRILYGDMAADILGQPPATLLAQKRPSGEQDSDGDD